MKKITPYILLIATLLFLYSCNDEEKFTTNTNAKVSFSADTISFDTVFTSIGSSTKNLQVYNNNKEGIRFQDIRLASGGDSGFRLNVDGQYGKVFNNVEVLANDSIFVFVEVTANPTDSLGPVLVQDSILFTLENGRCQRVLLQAYGQDVTILRGETLTDSTAHFKSGKPYVIYDSLVVAEGVTMTAEPGSVLCFHSDAMLRVHGKLNLEGTTEKPIILRGDRTDKIFPYLPYDRIDGQWEGIHLCKESSENIINNVDIHGGKYGVKCDSIGTEKTKVTILNSSIHNMTQTCLQSNSNKILVANTQLSNSGGNCVRLTGGDNNFYHVTIAQFYDLGNYDYALSFSNSLDDIKHPLTALKFYNSIITGKAEDVIQGSRFSDAEGKIDEEVAFNLEFNNCLVRTDTIGASEYFKDCVIESSDSTICGANNFKYIENYIYDFRLDTLSRARGIGNPTYIKDYNRDKNGVVRSSDHPDAGCFEFK